MAEKKQTSQGKNNSLIWGLIVCTIIGAWMGNELWLKLSEWSKIGYICVTLAACALMFLLTDHSKDLWSFAKESNVELRKVIWPEKHEAVRITGIIIVVVIAVSILLSLIDRLLFALIAMLTHL